jgi:hypothetical protein
MLQAPPREPLATRVLRALASVVRAALDAAASLLRGIGGVFTSSRGTSSASPPIRPAPVAPQAQRADPGPVYDEAERSGPLAESTPVEAAPDEAERSEPLAESTPPEAVPAPPAEPEPVLLGGSAPGTAQPGDVILTQFVAYVARFEEKARQVLERAAAGDEIVLGEQTDCRWAPGSRVVVRCRASGLVVPTPVQGFIWNGECRTVSFDIEVPADARPRDAVIVFEAFVGEDADDAPDPVEVGRLRIPIDITLREEDDPAPRRVQGEAARKAFASYASEDRVDVLERVSSIRRSAGLEVWMDIVDLRMGDRWEPALHEHIAASDRFLLFWSDHAARSEWVEREWRQAVDMKGEEVLELHLLRHTPIEDVPEPLRKFHFNDIYLLARDAELYRRDPSPAA